LRKVIDYKPLSIADLTRLSAMTMPCGLAWDSKNEPSSNFYKLIKGLAADINALEDRVYRLASQWDVRITDDLILEWEKAVGIPDECRKQAEDITVRRQDVVNKLKRIPVVTVADYKALAEILTGEPAATWNIRPGIVDFPDNPLYRFVLIVGAPSYTYGAFDYPFGSGVLEVSALTGADTVATATVSDTSSMVTATKAVIEGADQEEYNGTVVINIVSSTQFTYAFAGSLTTPATGSIKVHYGLAEAQVNALKANQQFLLKKDTVFKGYPFLGSFRSTVLQCVFRKVTPAHVALVFE
jgi:uncharacterized protein YmfQ (DUF2313 family)